MPQAASQPSQMAFTPWVCMESSSRLGEMRRLTAPHRGKAAANPLLGTLQLAKEPPRLLLLPRPRHLRGDCGEERRGAKRGRTTRRAALRPAMSKSAMGPMIASL